MTRGRKRSAQAKGKGTGRSSRAGSPSRRRRQLAVEGFRGAYNHFGYHAVRVARDQGRSITGGHPDTHQRIHREQLIDQSRQFMRDNGIFRGIIRRAVAYIVGRGFQLQMASKDKKHNQRVEADWRRFWTKGRPEIRGLLSGPRMERQVCQELLVCGDTGLVLTDRDRVQHVEAEQIKGPKGFSDGVRKDAFGTPTRFFVSPYGSGGRVSTSRAQEYEPGTEFLFLCDPDRPSGTRGVPPCQASFPLLHALKDICDSEAASWQIFSRLAFELHRENAAEQAHAESKADENDTDTEGRLAPRVSEMDQALIFHTEGEEGIKPVERNIPGRDFPQSVAIFLRLIGLPVGLPLEITLLDWTKSNYSQSRAVLEQAFVTFLFWQGVLEDFELTPIVEWRIQKLLGKTKDEAPDLYEHEWIRPTFPWLDQLKEAQAQALKLERGMTTWGIVLKAQGLDPDKIAADLVAETVRAIKTAEKIKKQTGVDVPWQRFCGLEADAQGKGVEAAVRRVVDRKREEDQDE